MTNWYSYALAAFFLMGTQNFLYKVSAERGYHTGWVTFFFMATVACLSSIMWLVRREPIADFSLLIFLSFLNSLSFLVATVTHIESLKHLPAATVYSVTRLNLVIVTLFSVFFLKDQISSRQIAGVLCAIGAIPILAQGPNKGETATSRGRQGFIYLAICLFASALASISSKYAAMYVSRIAFLTLVYTMATLASAGLGNRFRTATVKSNRRGTFGLGLAIGILNFAGYLAFLKALSSGPLSLVASIVSMHFVVAIVLSIFIYRERLTLPRALGFVLTVLSIALIGF
ncbi:DMT family transporter [Syntrophorhabdus aromaticivorans]|uniref:DMT family transporter n=1 Tax=Syntrophorhabdus aromaticivorans TaxID=328301 RepID=A0A971M7T0_9BACT|nr:DMT family transporter [Syntrophorhabdus aromaticivorans]NLW36774.1 DMT family transporter [Syntrophorhabdus aromaticivorans]